MMPLSDLFLLKATVLLIFVVHAAKAVNNDDANVFGRFMLSKVYSYEASLDDLSTTKQQLHLQVIGCVSDGFSDDNCSESAMFDTTKLKAAVSNLEEDDFYHWRYMKFQNSSPFVNFTIQNYSGTPYKIYINAKATIWKQGTVVVRNETFQTYLLKTVSIREDWNTEGQAFPVHIAYKGYSTIYRIEGEFVLTCGDNFYGCTCQKKCDASKIPHGYCNQFGKIECDNTYYPKEENLNYCKETNPNLIEACETQCEEPEDNYGRQIGICFRPCGEKSCYGWEGYHSNCTKKNCTSSLACSDHGTCKNSLTLNKGMGGTYGFFTCECDPGYNGPRCEYKSGTVPTVVTTPLLTEASTTVVTSKSPIKTTRTNPTTKSKSAKSNSPKTLPQDSYPSPESMDQSPPSSGMPGYAIFLLVMFILVIVGLGYSGFYYYNKRGFQWSTRARPPPLGHNNSASDDRPIRYNHQTTSIENPNYPEFNEAGL